MRHSHPHEQLVYVVRGHISVASDGSTFKLRGGDSFIVPGGADHEASALEASEVLDVFAPWRKDYLVK